MKIKFTVLLVFLTLILAACTSNQSKDMNHDENHEKAVENDTKVDGLQTTNVETLTGNEFTLVAKKAKHQLNNQVTVEAYTFNGSVPGSQIRVKEGEKVTIHFVNELSEPTSIHWHGLPVPNEMDGIPGVTQNAIQPGESFTYEFTAPAPGTYMYHSHQDSVNQIDKGLYGSFVVEPKEKTYDQDYTLMLDEWMSNPTASMNNMDGMDHSNMSGMDHSNMSGMDHSNMSGMDHSNMDGMDHSNMSGMDHSNMNGMDHSNMSGMDYSNMNGMDHSSSSSTGTQDQSGNATMGHNMNMYDIFTINGKSGDSIEPLKVKEGETVRIRLANIGYLPHNMHLHGHDFKVVAIDGQELNHPQEMKDKLISIAPGERYDIEFTADNPGEWYLECHGDMEGSKGMKALIQYEGNNESKDQSNQDEALPLFSYIDYGSTKDGGFTLDQKYDVEYTMDLNGNNMDNIWTINGKSFPNTDNINVKKGDLIKVKLTNNSPAGVNHPMHLHGHFFQVLSKNGQPIKGAPIWKDTINLESGDEYVVAFEADNPGNWMFHCHDLHHATAGMVDIVKYKGFEPSFTPDPNASNKPE